MQLEHSIATRMIHARGRTLSRPHVAKSNTIVSKHQGRGAHFLGDEGERSRASKVSASQVSKLGASEVSGYPSFSHVSFS